MFRKTQGMANTSSTLEDYDHTLRTLRPEVRVMFSHLEALVRLLLVNPASSASAERSFSSLRRLKTYVRSTMGQARLNHVGVCHVHANILDDIDTNVLMTKFVECKENRVGVFGRINC